MATYNFPQNGKYSLNQDVRAATIVQLPEINIYLQNLKCELNDANTKNSSSIIDLKCQNNEMVAAPPNVKSKCVLI